MTPTLSHTRLLVEEYAACFRFYRDVLDLEPTFGDAASGYADFDTGDVSLALFDADEMAAALAPADDLSGDSADDPAGDRADDPSGHSADEIASHSRVDTRGRDGAMLVFAVDDVDNAADRLAADADLVAPPTDHPEWGIRTVHVRDPDGTLVELNEPLED